MQVDSDLKVGGGFGDGGILGKVGERLWFHQRWWRRSHRVWWL